MKSDLLWRFAMDFSFGDSHPVEDGNGVFFYKFGEIALLDERADLRKTPAVGVRVAFFSVRMFVAVAVFTMFVMAMVMTVFVRLLAVLVNVTMAAFFSVLVVMAAVVGMLVPGVPVTLMGVLLMDMAVFFFVLVIVAAVVGMFMPRVRVIFMRVLMAVVMAAIAVAAIDILLVSMGRPFVNAEFDPLDGLALFALEVHVKVTDLQLGELPFEGGGFDAEVAERADSHVAADAGKTIEKENTHTFEAKA